MTNIIVGGFSRNNFIVLEFYKKRVTRIFPALLIATLFFAIVIYWLLPPQFINYLKNAAASCLFYSNIYYFTNSGYFDAASHQNFLLHTWSLSVEWQFYMIYPIMLILMRKISGNNHFKFNTIFWSILLFSFLFMVLKNHKGESSFSFYMFPTRAWEMMLGGAVFLEAPKIEKWNLKLRQLIAAISYICMFAFIFWLGNMGKSWPNFYTLIPVGATAFIILVNAPVTLFRNKVLKYVGDISYSLYLYHWPVYVLAWFFRLNFRFRYIVAIFLTSLILAILSHEFVEKRRFFRNFKTSLIMAITLFGPFSGYHSLMRQNI